MIRSSLRWVYMAVAVFAAGPACWWLVTLVPAPDGSRAAGATLSSQPVVALGAMAGAFILAAVVGGLGARLFSSERTGFFSAGLVLAWGSWGVARLGGYARSVDTVRMTDLSYEGAALGVMGCAVAWSIWAARQAGMTETHKRGQGAAVGFVGPMIAVAIGGVVAWAVARSDAPGQGLAAAAFAAMFGALVGKLFDVSAPDRMFMVSALALAVFAPVVTGMMGAAPLTEQIFSGFVFPIGRVMPIDWMGGALLGIPVGSAWAASMIDKRSQQPAAR